MRRSFTTIFACLLLPPVSSRATDADEVRRQTGIDTGLSVVIADGLDLAADLADEGRMVVHLLTTKTDTVEEFREEVQARKLGGRVVVEATPLTRLPYPDRFVNLVVADMDVLADEGPTRKEVLRVLAVRGVGYLKEDGKWHRIDKPRDDRLDGWFARWYDSTGNCVSKDRIAGFPRAVQWQHGPAMEDGTTDGKVVRVAEGRMLAVDVATGDLICRDAGNGSLLWRRATGLKANDDFVLVDGLAYLFVREDKQDAKQGKHLPDLVALELSTGKLVQTFDQGVRAGSASPIEFEREGMKRRETPEPWFVVNEQVIVQAYEGNLVVLDRKTGKRKWQQTLETGTWFSPIISNNLVVSAEAIHPARRGRHDGSSHIRAIAAFALEDGRPVWRNENVHPARELADQKTGKFTSRAEFKPLSAAGERILVHVSSYQFRQGGSIALLDAKSGKELWRQEFQPKELYTQGSQRAVLRGDEVLILDGMGARRYEAGTGKPIGEPVTLPRNLKRLARANGACTASRATLDWLFCNATLYVGPEGEVDACFGARGSCGQGVIPAHGLVFVPPTACDCGDYARGYLALTPVLPGTAIADANRPGRGPAFGKIEPTQPPGAGSWPTFLGDSRRSSRSTGELPAELKPLWTVKAVDLRADGVDQDRRDSERYLGALSAPVVGQGLVVVASPETHQVLAFDAATGKHRWAFNATGKIDSPPTLADGLAVFGCDDGTVYALRLNDGKLCWRFRAAPTDARAMLHGHLASAFPISGSVLVLGDAVVAVAGHHTDLGGLHCWVLDLHTGGVKATRVIRADQPCVVTNGVAVADHDGKSFWIGRQLHLTLDLKELPVDRFAGPEPLVGFDRHGPLVRFRTSSARGGSTHGWKGAVRVSGKNRFVVGHRMAAADDLAYGLNDPVQGRKTSPVAWAVRREDREANPTWQLTQEDLPHESYGAMVLAGRRLYIAGGSRDGRTGVLHIIDAGTGKVRATHTLPARATECGLAVADGRLIVACEDGSLVCLGSGGVQN